MIAEEKYEFKPETKRKIFILGLVGLLLFGAGVFFAMRSGGGHEGSHEKHASASITKELTASVAPVVQEEHGNHEAKAEATSGKSNLAQKNLHFTLAEQYFLHRHWDHRSVFCGYSICGSGRMVGVNKSNSIGDRKLDPGCGSAYAGTLVYSERRFIPLDTQPSVYSGRTF